MHKNLSLWGSASFGGCGGHPLGDSILASWALGCEPRAGASSLNTSPGLRQEPQKPARGHSPQPALQTQGSLAWPPGARGAKAPPLGGGEEGGQAVRKHRAFSFQVVKLTSLVRSHPNQVAVVWIFKFLLSEKIAIEMEPSSWCHFNFWSPNRSKTRAPLPVFRPLSSSSPFPIPI